VLVHLESFIISSEMRHEHNMICPIPAVADRTSPGAVMRNTQPQLRPYDPSFRTLLPAQDDKETSRHDPMMEEEKRAGTIQSWKRRNEQARSNHGRGGSSRLRVLVSPRTRMRGTRMYRAALAKRLKPLLYYPREKHLHMDKQQAHQAMATTTNAEGSTKLTAP
jgi:hypothetical protein